MINTNQLVAKYDNLLCAFLVWSAGNKTRNRRSHFVRNCRSGTLAREIWANLSAGK